MALWWLWNSLYQYYVCYYFIVGEVVVCLCYKKRTTSRPVTQVNSDSHLNTNKLRKPRALPHYTILIFYPFLHNIKLFYQCKNEKTKVYHIAISVFISTSKFWYKKQKLKPNYENYETSFQTSFVLFTTLHTFSVVFMEVGFYFTLLYSIYLFCILVSSFRREKMNIEPFFWCFQMETTLHILAAENT